MATAQEIIKKLNLSRHPEGGWYYQTFEDEEKLDEHSRSCSTAIFYVLEENDRSHWHRVDAAEVWHYYAGAPLELSFSWDDGKPVRHQTLGPDILNGQNPQGIVSK